MKYSIHAQREKTFEQRLWEKIDRRGPDECWEWTAYKNWGGYGIVKMGRKTVRSHRAAWEVCNSPIPSGMIILHSCDNPACCNPSHLRLGTPSENADDRNKKDRTGHIRPEKASKTKLTWEAVREIRKLHKDGVGKKELANRYGVSRSNISSIVRFLYWKEE